MGSFTRWVELSCLFAITLPVQVASAEDFTLAKEWQFDATAESLVSVIIACDQSCDHGCGYRAPHVTQALILSQHRTPDDFYVWTSVQDVRNTTFFSHVRVMRSPGRIHVSMHLVGPKFAAELQKLTGHPHQPNFDDSITTFELEQQTQAGATKTRVRYADKLVLSGLAALFGASIVRDQMEESARATNENLLSVR